VGARRSMLHEVLRGEFVVEERRGTREGGRGHKGVGHTSDTFAIQK